MVFIYTFMEYIGGSCGLAAQTQLPPMDFIQPVDRIYVSIDMNDAGSPEIDAVARFGSAIVAMAQQRGMVYTSTFYWHNCILETLTRLRSHPMTRNALLIVNVERGPGFASIDACNFIHHKFQNVQILYNKDIRGAQFYSLKRLTLSETREGMFTYGWKHFIGNRCSNTENSKRVIWMVLTMHELKSKL